MDEDYRGEEYMIPRKISSKFFFNLSIFDMIIIIAVFFFCNSVLSPIFKNFMETVPRMVFINYGPAVMLYSLLQENPKTGESLMDILIDCLIFEMKSKKYIYKGDIYNKKIKG